MTDKWQRFCDVFSVPVIYQDCALDGLSLDAAIMQTGFRFLKQKPSLLLQGLPGRGKTFYMYAIINSLLKLTPIDVHEVLMLNAQYLDSRIEEEIYKYRSASYYMSRICEVPFLFIDDFGVEFSKEKAEKNYYSILETRLSNKMPTILSTNLSDDEILSIFGARISSRLKQCVKVIFDGPDLREPPIMFSHE